MELILKNLRYKIQKKSDQETNDCLPPVSKTLTGRSKMKNKATCENKQSSSKDHDLVYNSDGSETDSNQENIVTCCECCSPYKDHNYAKCSLLKPMSGRAIAKAAETSDTIHQTGEDGLVCPTVIQISDNGERIMVLHPGSELLGDPLISQNIHEAMVTEERECEIPPHDPSCEWRIDSVCSLASGDLSKHNEGNKEPKQSGVRTEALTMSLKDSSWEKFCKTCFVVLERMPLSHVNKTERDKAKSHCSLYCRQRTLNLMCSMNLLASCQPAVGLETDGKADQSLPILSQLLSSSSGPRNNPSVSTTADNPDVSLKVASSSKVDPKNLNKTNQWLSKQKNTSYDNEIDISDSVGFVNACSRLKQQIDFKRNDMQAQKLARKMKNRTILPQKKFPPTINGIPISPVTVLNNLDMMVKIGSRPAEQIYGNISTISQQPKLSNCPLPIEVRPSQNIGSNSVPSTKQPIKAILPQNAKGKLIVFPAPLKSPKSVPHQVTPIQSVSSPLTNHIPSTTSASKNPSPIILSNTASDDSATKMLNYLSTQHQLTSFSSSKTSVSHLPSSLQPSRIIVHNKMNAAYGDSASQTKLLASIPSRKQYKYKPSIVIVPSRPSSSKVNTNATSSSLASTTKMQRSLSTHHQLTPPISLQHLSNQTLGSASTINTNTMSTNSATKTLSFGSTQIQPASSTSQEQSSSQCQTKKFLLPPAFSQKPSSSTAQMNVSPNNSASKTLRSLSAQIQLTPSPSDKQHMDQPLATTNPSTLSGGNPPLSNAQVIQTSVLPTVGSFLLGPTPTPTTASGAMQAQSSSAEPLSGKKLNAALKSVSEFVKSCPKQIKSDKSNYFLVKVGNQQVLLTTEITMVRHENPADKPKCRRKNKDGTSAGTSNDIASATKVNASTPLQTLEQSNQSKKSLLPFVLAQLNQTSQISIGNLTALTAKQLKEKLCSSRSSLTTSGASKSLSGLSNISSQKNCTGLPNASNIQSASTGSHQSGIRLLPAALSQVNPSASVSDKNVTMNIPKSTEIPSSSQPLITPTEELERLLLAKPPLQKDCTDKTSASSLQQTTTISQQTGACLMPVALSHVNPSGTVSDKTVTLNIPNSVEIPSSSPQLLVTSTETLKRLMLLNSRHGSDGKKEAKVSNLQQTPGISHQSEKSLSPVPLTQLNQTDSTYNKTLTATKTNRSVEVSSSSVKSKCTASTSKRCLTELSQEDIKRRKRRKLEEKYPLPQGVIIKAEPLTEGYELDNNWSVDSEVDIGFIRNESISHSPHTDTFAEGSSVKNDTRNASFKVDLPGKNECDDQPPVLDNFAGWSSTHCTSDSDNQAPPTLQPMAPSLPSSSFSDILYQGEEDEVISIPDNETDASSLPPALKTLIESPLNMSPRESGYNSLSCSSSMETLDSSPSSTSALTHADHHLGQEKHVPKHSTSRLQQLKELLKQKEMQVENMRRIRSTMPQIDLESV